MSENRFNKVVVGVDFSPAENALLSCLPELKRWGTETLVLAHMVPVGYTSVSGYGHEGDYLQDLEKTAGPLREAGLTVETLVRDSTHPAKAFAALADEVDANMIVVGSRSHNFLHKLFLGSFATEVIQHARVPVLIERIEKSARQTVATCEAVCRQNLDRILLATDLSPGGNGGGENRHCPVGARRAGQSAGGHQQRSFGRSRERPPGSPQNPYGPVRGCL